MPKAYITHRRWISYRRYITRSDRNGYHRKKSLLSTRQKRFFTMISVPLGHGWYTLRVWYLLRRWYTLRVWRNGYYIIFAKQIYHTALPYIISRQRYIIEKCNKRWYNKVTGWCCDRKIHKNIPKKKYHTCFNLCDDCFYTSAYR